jgi:hypothetical protein
MAMNDFEGLDISELGGVGRFFGAMVCFIVSTKRCGIILNKLYLIKKP